MDENNAPVQDGAADGASEEPVVPAGDTGAADAAPAANDGLGDAPAADPGTADAAPAPDAGAAEAPAEGGDDSTDSAAV